MNKKECKLVTIVLLVLMLTCVITGCKSKEKYEKDEELGKNVTTNIGTKKSNELVDKVEGIADDMVDLIGVENATAIIYNEQVVIVLKLDQNIDFSDELKDMVRDIVLNKDFKVKKIFVSNNEKLFDKVDDIAQNLIKGEDIKKHSKEIDKIIKKIEKEN